MGYFIVTILAFLGGYISGLITKAQLKQKSKENLKSKANYSAPESGNYIIEGGRLKMTDKGVSNAIEKAQKEIRGKSFHVKDRSIMPTSRQAPPPPAPKKLEIHMKPGFSYDRDTFVNVTKCKGCNTIGYGRELWAHKPCISCGGKVKEIGAGKWGHDKWVMSKA